MLVNSARLQQKMNDEGLDAIVATSLENVFYFTGFRSVSLSMFPHEGQCYVIVTQDRPAEPHIVSPILEADQILDGFDNVRGVTVFGTFYREGPEPDITLSDEEQRLQQMAVLEQSHSNPLDALIEALQSLGLADKKIGIDEIGFRSGFFEQITEKLPAASFQNASALLRWVRRVKTEEEIRRIRASAHVTENAIVAAAGIAQAGITEYEMAREFERSIVSQGGIPMFTLIRFGRNAVAGQVQPNQTPLQPGDVIWFDVGCVFQGYWSDLARNFSLGEPSARAQGLYRAMFEGEQQAIESIHAGMSGADAFDLTINATRNAGAPAYRRHHLGHGIGLEVYEQPLIAPGANDLIEENSVVNIETPYYEYGLGALHVEDPFVVRSNGNELLTTLGRDLHIIA